MVVISGGRGLIVFHAVFRDHRMTQNVDRVSAFAATKFKRTFDDRVVLLNEDRSNKNRANLSMGLSSDSGLAND